MFSIFILVFGAVALGLVIAVFITRKSPAVELGMVIPEDDFHRDPKDAKQLGMADLRELAGHICEKNQLIPKEKIVDSKTEEHWILENQNPIYGGCFVFTLFEATPLQPYVLLPELLKFKDFVKSMRGTRGFYFTTGYFAREVHQPLEGLPVTLYNRIKILEEMKENHLL